MIRQSVSTHILVDIWNRVLTGLLVPVDIIIIIVTILKQLTSTNNQTSNVIKVINFLYLTVAIVTWHCNVSHICNAIESFTMHQPVQMLHAYIFIVQEYCSKIAALTCYQLLVYNSNM